MKRILLLLSVISYALCLVPSAASADFTTKARAAFLLDDNSGAVIVAKNADTPMPPSSMLKMMTLAMTFDAISAGKLQMDDRVAVPDAADYHHSEWNDASKICLVAGQKVSVRDLIMGTIVVSGGDAAVTLATKLAGNEQKMTTLMTRRAREIGLGTATFGNVSGLPNPDNLMTARELATLAQYIIDKYPKFYKMFGAKKFDFSEYQTEWCADWGRIHSSNYNRLLFLMPAADGLKTGHTDDGGYGTTVSAVRGGRRLIAVINGFNTNGHDGLAREAMRLLNFGFTSTDNKVFFAAGDKIATIPTWYGRDDSVVATVARPFAVTLPHGAGTADVTIVARYNSPAVAPIARGAKIGELIATRHGAEIARAPLVAADAVGRTHFVKRIWQNLEIIF